MSSPIIRRNELPDVVQRQSPQLQSNDDNIPPVPCDVATTSSGPPDVVQETVKITNDVSELTKLQKDQIDNFIRNWRAQGANTPVRVDGYASKTGPTDHNWALSCWRASSVGAELKTPLAPDLDGIPESFITIFMHGETTEFPSEAENRRATISADIPPTPPAPPPEPPSCAPDKGCPPDFCKSLSKADALSQRARLKAGILAGIAIEVSPRVLDLWALYIEGGTATVQDLTGRFAPDFTADPTTTHVTNFLVDTLADDLRANPPEFPAGMNSITIDIVPRIGPALAAITNPKDPQRMEFSGTSIPGNLAGGIGTNEAACPVGKIPSTQPDDRLAAGAAKITKDAASGDLVVEPSIIYTVHDTIDVCPGACGSGAALIATVPLSQWEASGISGDVPFVVTFPAPAMNPTIVVLPPSPSPPTPPPSPTPAPTTYTVVPGDYLVKIANDQCEVEGHLRGQ